MFFFEYCGGRAPGGDTRTWYENAHHPSPRLTSGTFARLWQDPNPADATKSRSDRGQSWRRVVDHGRRVKVA